MRDEFKTTTTIRLKGGLNLLCASTAGYLLSKTLIMLANYDKEKTRLRDLEKSIEAVEKLEKITNKIDKVKIKVDDSELADIKNHLDSIEKKIASN